MALFKILKGSSTDLSSQKIREGYCYVTTDEGKMYIDISNDERICLNSGDSGHADSADTANKLTYQHLINGVKFDGSSDIYFYGECATAAATAAKTVTLQDGSAFVLKEGATIAVKFTKNNTAKNPTLNINETGAKPIYRYGTTAVSTSDASSGWRAGAILLLTYDGTGWVRHFWENTDTIPTAYCTTAAGTATKSASCTSYVALAKSYLHLIIKTSNTAESALKLNVNSQGAKPIYINGVISSASHFTLPAGSYITYYDGTNYYIRTDGKLPGSIEAADSANRLGKLSVGDENHPVFFSNGTPQGVDVIDPAYGGTGEASLIDSSNALLNALETGSSVPKDNDYFISQYADGGTTYTTYHRRPVSKLYEYIKTKASGTWGIDISGKAANADYATAAGTAGSTNINLNGSSQSTADAAFYAPVDAGTSGQILQSNGANKAPTWVNKSDADNKVLQSKSTTASWRPILSHVTAGSQGVEPDEKTGQVYYTGKAAIQPSTGSIYTAGNISASGNATITGNVTAGGTIIAKTGVYEDNYTGALNMGNSNIYGVNSIYTADLADNSAEGIHFYRTATNVDTLWARNGVLYFVPNRKLGDSSSNGSTILHSGNYTSYTVKKDGTGASGTWGISITGNAATATKADSADSATYATSAGTAGSAGSATNDSAGNKIVDTYVKKSGDTMTGALTTSYTSSTWINSANGKSAINLTGTTYTGWISGNSKDGRLVISSYPGSNNTLYFGYMSNQRIADGTNSFEKQMTWDGATNTLTATTFKGALDGNAATATYATSAGTAASAGTANSAKMVSTEFDTTSSRYINVVQVYKADGTATQGYIGMHNTGNTNGAIIINPAYDNTTDRWNTKLGLYIGQTALKFWDQPILHSGNYTTYTVKKDGTGATGTWGINITGKAADAAKSDYATSAGTAGTAGHATNADHAITADSATKATQDGDGNTISSTYAKVKTWNNFVHNSNEFTFAAPAYGGTDGAYLWINYRTASGGTDGNITGYKFGNGKGAITGVTVEAATFKGALDGNAKTATYATSAGTAGTAGVANSVAWNNVTDKPSSYPPSSHAHDYITYKDTRNDNQSPDDLQAGLTVHLKTNSTDGLADGGTYHAVVGIKDWGDYSGGPYGQIATTKNENLWFRTSTSGTAWGNWKKIIHSDNIGSQSVSYATSAGTAGSTNITLNGTAQSTASASFYAPTAAGTVGQVLVSSGSSKAPVWSNVYVKKTSSTTTATRTTAGDINALYIYGQTYGNTATNLETAGKMSYGDPGPQIIFNTAANGSQAAALIFTDHDTIATGTSLSLVSNQSNVSFIAPTIKALTKFVGELDGNAKTATNANYATSAGTAGTAGSATTAGSASRLLTLRSIGSGTTDHGAALKAEFNSNKNTIPRNELISYYSSTSGNGSQYMGYFLSGYNDNPYGGFFVAHYNNPYYVGISNGTYTQQSILTSTNFNSYAPKLDGTGATGTWGINISGNANYATSAGTAGTAGSANSATTANQLAQNTRMDYGWNGLNYFNISGTAGNAAKTNDTPTSAWWHILRFNHANSSGYYTDLAVPFNANSLYYKRIASGTVQNSGWVKVLDALNYNSYAPKLDGTGATGTWAISITGNAATATYATSAGTAGSAGKLTDINANDAASSTATWRRLWFCYNDNTTGRPAYDDRFAIQTSTGTLKAPIFSGNLSGNASSASLLIANSTALTSTTVDSALESSASLKINKGDNTIYNTNDGLILTASWSASYGAQIWLDDGGGEGGMAIRNRNANGWNPWRQVITSANIGSQSVAYAASAGTVGSVPNGALPLRLRNYQSSGFTNANEAVETGFHYITANTNRPAFRQSSNMDYRILTTAYSDIWLQQIATDYRCDDIFFRRKENGTWKSWVQILTTGGMNGRSSSWWNGRDNALLRQITANGYSPAISIKTTNGSWEIGHYNASNWHEQLLFNYKSDTSYAKGGEDNTVVHAFKFLNNGHMLLGNTVYVGPNNISSYGSLRVYGGAKTGYEGLHFGSGNNGMTVMSIDGSHQGLYQESTGTWIIYNLNGLIGLGGSSTTSGYKVTTNGSHYITGDLYVAGGDISGANLHGDAKGIYSSGYGNNNFTWYQTDAAFAGRSGWASYLISNHGDGSNYYHQIIAMPFWGAPCYRRLEGGTAKGWYDFITDENYTTKLDGRYVNVSGDTMSGELNMNNNTLSNIGQLTFADPGAQEGITWTGGNGWYIYESPDNLSNNAGNLQFVHGSTRRLTIRTDGYIDANAHLLANNGLTFTNMNWTAPGNITCVKNSNGSEFSFDMGADTQWHVWSTPNGASILSCFANNRNVQVHNTLTVNNRIYADEWIQFAGSTGLYFPGADCNGLHVLPNTVSSFAPVRIVGSRGGYNGIHFGDNNTGFTVMSSEPHQGLYNESKGRWVLYYHRSNNLISIGNSTVRSDFINMGGQVYTEGNVHINNGGHGGIGLYNTSSPNTYGIHMSLTSNYGTHGDVSGDWATYFCFDGATNRGWIFKHAGTNVASISGSGYMRLNGQLRNTSYKGGMWVSGRDNALVRTMHSTSGSSFAPVISAKTQLGSWELGPCHPNEDFYFNYTPDSSYNAGTNSGTVHPVRITNAGQLYGAVWNDYAEYRSCITTFEAGQVVCENGDDTLSLATERLQPGACIVSDTFGFAIGETDIADCPIAVAGRVLAYPYEPRESYKAGDPVCAGPGGTVSKMTREEVREYPDRMIGTVSAIPKYETWGQDNVPVNGRIWIKVV